MKTLLLQFIVTSFTLLSFLNENFAQIPELNSASNYVLFTTTGGIGNTGTSQITGNIGTGTGAITGFEPPSTMTGNIDSGNVATTQCSADLQAAYDELYNMAPTSTSHAPAFGSGETLFAGVYAIAAAGSVAGDLTLDAQWDPNAIFIFKFGGAFTTGASTTIHLINGALACNVFWGAEGAISMATLTDIKGTLIANNGAISMGAGGILEGRMFSTSGAASIYAVSVSVPPCSYPVLPIELLSFAGLCDKQNVILKWRTTTETSNRYFAVERSNEGINWQMVGTVAGSGNSSSHQTYTLTDIHANNKPSFYRLKQTDVDGNYKYGNILFVKKCTNEAANNLIIYPNPSNGKFELLFKDRTEQPYSIEIFNLQGQKLYNSKGDQSKFDLSNQAPGVYFMRVQQNSKTQNMKFVIEN
jgi:hypothetical protein